MMGYMCLDYEKGGVIYARFKAGIAMHFLEDMIQRVMSIHVVLSGST